jgi:hypothetical protein
MYPPKVETGFIGFFDILGYKSLLETGITDKTLNVIEILRSGFKIHLSRNRRVIMAQAIWKKV